MCEEVYPLLRRFCVPAVAALALVAPQIALAHAVLIASTPSINGVVRGGTIHVDLKFNSRVDGPHCTLSLAMPDGRIRVLALLHQPAPAEIATNLNGLSRGAYALRWQALASDGHITRGEIPFRVE